MVKSRITKHAQINRDLITSAIAIFGKKTLALRVLTRTVDAFGQLSVLSAADTTFTGDLQFGLDIDQRFITTGIVEVGDGVLYIHPSALSTLPSPQDQVVDGNSVWEIHSQIESPELDGTVTHYSYRCRREINVSDN
jgi:hypothetical protein